MITDGGVISLMLPCTPQEAVQQTVPISCSDCKPCKKLSHGGVSAPACQCAAVALRFPPPACPGRTGHTHITSTPFPPASLIGLAPDSYHHAAAAVSSLLRCLQVSAMMKKHLVEGVVPVLIELKRALEGQQHWLLRDLLAAIRMLLKDYKHEVSVECTHAEVKDSLVGCWQAHIGPFGRLLGSTGQPKQALDGQVSPRSKCAQCQSVKRTCWQPAACCVITTSPKRRPVATNQKHGWLGNTKATCMLLKEFRP